MTEVAVMGGDKLYWRQPIYALIFHQHTLGYGQDACYTGSPNYLAWRGVLRREQYERGFAS